MLCLECENDKKHPYKEANEVHEKCQQFPEWGFIFKQGNHGNSTHTHNNHLLVCVRVAVHAFTRRTYHSRTGCESDKTSDWQCSCFQTSSAERKPPAGWDRGNHLVVSQVLHLITKWIHAFIFFLQDFIQSIGLVIVFMFSVWVVCLCVCVLNWRDINLFSQPHCGEPFLIGSKCNVRNKFRIGLGLVINK